MFSVDKIINKIGVSLDYYFSLPFRFLGRYFLPKVIQNYFVELKLEREEWPTGWNDYPRNELFPFFLFVLAIIIFLILNVLTVDTIPEWDLWRALGACLLMFFYIVVNYMVFLLWILGFSIALRHFVIGEFSKFLIVFVIGFALSLSCFIIWQVYQSGKEGIVIFALFYMVIPIINACFDFISTYVSRIFAENIVKTNSKSKIIIDIVVDFLVAIGLFVLLAWSLYSIVDFMNMHYLVDENLRIPIEDYRNSFIQNPFSIDVLWITLILFSTLIPTIFHLYLAIYGFLGHLITKPFLFDLLTKLSAISSKTNLRDKEIVAQALAKYNLASSIKVHLIGGTFLIVVLLILLFLIFLKVSSFSM